MHYDIYVTVCSLDQHDSLTVSRIPGDSTRVLVDGLRDGEIGHLSLGWEEWRELYSELRACGWRVVQGA